MKNFGIKAMLSFAIEMALVVSVVMSMVLPDTFVYASEQETLRVENNAENTGNNSYSFSGPYAYKNLAIFLIHASSENCTTKFMTLQEALDQKNAIVAETGTVNKLVIENVSDDVHIYIQSGDIVRGGKQDRTLGYDYIIPPGSGKIPISSFCVERGRWQQRGNEKAGEFSVSNKVLPSKGLKIAANYNSSQRFVWDEVEDFQNKLSSNLGTSVRSKQSASSLELTLENKVVKKAVQEYVNLFSRLIESKEDTVGFAYAINGKVDGAEIYSSSELFKKLWPKLIQASSLEAIAEIQETKEYRIPTVRYVRAFLRNEENARISEKQINEQLKSVTRLSKEKVVFETYDQSRKQALHKSYIRADHDLLKQKPQPARNPQIRQIDSSLEQEQQELPQ